MRQDKFFPADMTPYRYICESVGLLGMWLMLWAWAVVLG